MQNTFYSNLEIKRRSENDAPGLKWVLTEVLEADYSAHYGTLSALRVNFSMKTYIN